MGESPCFETTAEQLTERTVLLSCEGDLFGQEHKLVAPDPSMPEGAERWSGPTRGSGLRQAGEVVAYPALEVRKGPSNRGHIPDCQGGGEDACHLRGHRVLGQGADTGKRVLGQRTFERKLAIQGLEVSREFGSGMMQRVHGAPARLPVPLPLRETGREGSPPARYPVWVSRNPS